MSFIQSSYAVEDCGLRGHSDTTRLITQINTLGVQDLWDFEQAQKLSFCVSNKFRSNYDHMKKVSVLVAKEWMKYANVNFQIVDDMSCESNPRKVLFAIVPTTRRAPYKARAFFPSSERKRIRVNRRFTDIAEKELFQLMLHEFGHVLGFRHEHIHPEAGGECVETGEFEPLTDYDPASIMHYPNCDQGLNNFVLSDNDKLGASLAYP